jgi:polysaccharide export outer membrane protein
MNAQPSTGNRSAHAPVGAWLVRAPLGSAFARFPLSAIRLALCAYRFALTASLFALGSLASASDPAPTDYVLQPADLLRIVVFQQPDLQRDVRITQEYTINLPLLGSVNLRDKSVRQAEELIRELYDRDYLVNPQISLTVLEYTQRTVKVLGAVNQPGAIEFPTEQKMGLLEAIARAGGFSRLADRRKVRLSRTLADGKSENFTINADDLIQGDSTEPWLLTKDDVIFVPERLL